MPMLKDDRHIQSTVALLENSSSANSQTPFQAIDLSNDVALPPEASATATLGGHTSTRSKREIIALDGFMFDSSVLQDRDDQVIMNASELHQVQQKGKENKRKQMV
jgi:hypothetical protein